MEATTWKGGTKIMGRDLRPERFLPEEGGTEGREQVGSLDGPADSNTSYTLYLEPPARVNPVLALKFQLVTQQNTNKVSGRVLYIFVL